jgi:tetratricopeptide (TPR) repeat protein
MTLKDKKHWAHKSEAAQDEVRDALEMSFDWVMANRRQAAYGAGAIAAVALIVGFFIYQRNASIDAAWDKLSQAELYAYSGRAAESLPLLNEAASGASPAASAMAHILEGDLHYPKGEYDQALASYDKAAAEAPENLRPFAQADRVMALEAAGKAADCAAAAQSFLSTYPEHLLAPQTHTALARCQQAAGQADAAKSTLQRISLQYQGTPWAAWASSRLAAPAK